MTDATARPSRSATRALGAGAVVAVVTLLAGCGVLIPGPSPTSTYVDESGATRIADWVDYPAYAGFDGEAVLVAPDQAELEPQARALVESIRAAIEAEAGVALMSVTPEASWFDDDNWFPQTGNGYGGESMLITVNCCDLTSDEAPDPERWRDIIAAASQATVDAGLGPLEIDHDDATDGSDAEYRDQYCTGADGECWLISAGVFDDYQWLWVSIEDGALDPSGDAARDAEANGRPLASISISYGATVVRSGESGAYARAMEPFRGLEQPPATVSD